MGAYEKWMNCVSQLLGTRQLLRGATLCQCNYKQEENLLSMIAKP